MTRRTIATLAVLALTLAATAQPAHATLGKILTGKAEIVDGRYHPSAGTRVQTGNLPSSR
jgi:hypothetical protein